MKKICSVVVEQEEEAAEAAAMVQEVKTEMVEEEKMNKLDPSQPHLKVKMKV